MKKYASLALMGALTLSLAGSALAMPPGATKLSSITVNGTALTLPQTQPAGEFIPMRAFVEADNGGASWYAEDNQSLFYIDGASMIVDFATGTADVLGEVFDGAFASNGVTYAPVAAVEAMAGVSVTVNDGVCAIQTPSADPMVQLAKTIQETTGMASGSKATMEELVSFWGAPEDAFEELVAYLPMMVRADTVIVAKAADGKMKEVKQFLEDRKAATIQSFEQYLPDPLEMAKQGKVVTNGDYAMLIISPDNSAAVKLFNDFVKAQ